MLYIFSDESGTVYTTEQPYYVRSFIFIKEENYKKLKEEFSRLQENTGVKEVKFDKFVANPQAYGSIFNIEFEAYVVYANVRKDFLNRKRRYNYEDGLNEFFKSELFDDEVVKPFKESVQEKIRNAFKSFVWLHYFEKYFIKYSKDALRYYYELKIADSKEYRYYFDVPQFTKKDYERIVTDDPIRDYQISKDRVSIVKSEEWEGIQLADIVAGSVKKMLLSLEEKKDEKVVKEEGSKDLYFKYVWNKLLGFDRYSDCMRSLPDDEDYFCSPNPCKVHKPKSREETREYNDLLKPKWYRIRKTK